MITIAAGVMVTLTEELRVPSAFAIAVTVTLLVAGTEFGAVYNPFESIVPTVKFPPAMPLTCQLTSVFAEKVTAAVNCWVSPACTDTPEGLTLIGKAMVTVASAVLLASAPDMPVMVTVCGLGTVDGAVYRPDPVMVPEVGVPPATPFTSQFTVLLLAFFTSAVNCCVALVATVAVVGEIAIDTALAVVLELLPPPHPHSDSKRMTQTVQE